ncbi:MAG: Hpt domain-containing protein [Halanaerobacter sp.]
MSEKVPVDQDLKALIPIFMDNREEDITKLKELLAESDLEGIKRVGHNLKGTGGGYGFDKITELGRQIEEAAKEENEDSLEELIAELEIYLEEVEITYE